MPALRYYGGKFRCARKIAAHFPPHLCYVEPFGGACGVLLRKEPSDLEVYNDLNGRLVNFFRMVRDRPQQLIRLLKRTPYSREEFLGAYEQAADPMEDARRFFVTAWQSFGGASGTRRTGWKRMHRKWDNCRAHITADWVNAIRNLALVRQRFERVQIEHDDALAVIARYDSPDALFYVDPPYPSETRNRRWCQRAYSHEMGALDHELLAAALMRVQGTVVLSSYPNEQYSRLFSGWHRVEFQAQTMNRTSATEVLWMNKAPSL
ncbi:MAG: DNA adenine methylase [Verrucomicrobiota bacterium]